MSNLPTLRLRAHDSDGVIAPGAELNTWAAGTVFPQATYTTEALDVAHANPIIAGAGGLFPEIFLTEDLDYRFVLKTTGGALTIYDVDNISPATLDNALLSQFYQLAENPLHFGALGDGVADESTEVQAAITAAALGGNEGLVDLLGLVFRCDSQITIPDGVTVQNGTLDFSACDDDSCVLGQGTLGATLALTGNAAEGANVVALDSVSNLAAGDLIYITESSGASKGELQRIASIASLNVSVAATLLDAYTTANTATVNEITPKKKLTLRNLRLLGNTGASGTGDVVFLKYCEDARVIDCTIENPKSGASGIVIDQSISSEVRGCTIKATATGAAGVTITNTARDTLVDGCSFLQMSVGVAIAPGTPIGVTSFATVSRCRADGCISLSTDSKLTRFIDIVDNTLHGNDSLSTIGVVTSGRDVTIDNNTLHGNASTLYGVHADYDNNASLAAYSTPRNLAVTNNKISNADRHIYIDMDALATDAVTVEQVLIANNKMESSGADTGVYVKLLNTSAIPTLDGLSIIGNQFSGGASSYLVDIESATGGILTDVLIANNRADIGAIRVAGNATTVSSAVVIRDNILEATATVIEVSEAEQLSISGNTVRGTVGSTLYGIYVTQTTLEKGVTVSDNSITGVSGGTSATNRGILVENSDLVKISDNSISDTNGNIDKGIYVNETTGSNTSLMIKGNIIADIRAAAGNAGIRVDQTGTDQFSSCVIAANSVVSACECLHIEDALKNAAVSGNSFTCTVTATYDCVDMTAGGSADIANVAITGNAIRGGVYGVDVLNDTSAVIHSGNAFESQGTSHQNGLAAGTNTQGGDYAT